MDQRFAVPEGDERDLIFFGTNPVERNLRLSLSNEFCRVDNGDKSLQAVNANGIYCWEGLDLDLVNSSPGVIAKIHTVCIWQVFEPGGQVVRGKVVYDARSNYSWYTVGGINGEPGAPEITCFLLDNNQVELERFNFDRHRVWCNTDTFSLGPIHPRDPRSFEQATYLKFHCGKGWWGMCR